MKTTPLLRMSWLLIGVYVVAKLFGGLPNPWDYIVIGAAIVASMIVILRTLRTSRAAR